MRILPELRGVGRPAGCSLEDVLEGVSGAEGHPGSEAGRRQDGGGG